MPKSDINPGIYLKTLMPFITKIKIWIRFKTTISINTEIVDRIYLNYWNTSQERNKSEIYLKTLTYLITEKNIWIHVTTTYNKSQYRNKSRDLFQ